MVGTSCGITWILQSKYDPQIEVHFSFNFIYLVLARPTIGFYSSCPPKPLLSRLLRTCSLPDSSPSCRHPSIVTPSNAKCPKEPQLLLQIPAAAVPAPVGSQHQGQDGRALGLCTAEAIHLLMVTCSDQPRYRRCQGNFQ